MLRGRDVFDNGEVFNMIHAQELKDFKYGWSSASEIRIDSGT